MAATIGHHQKVNKSFAPKNWLEMQLISMPVRLLGHVDPGEDDFTTALRETREEAGYTDADLNIFKTQTKTLNYQVKGKPKAVVYWLAELRNPNSDPKLSDEHTEFRWLAKDEAIELSGFKDFADMIEYFDHSIPSLQS